MRCRRSLRMAAPRPGSSTAPAKATLSYSSASAPSAARAAATTHALSRICRRVVQNLPCRPVALSVLLRREQVRSPWLAPCYVRLTWRLCPPHAGVQPARRCSPWRAPQSPDPVPVQAAACCNAAKERACGYGACRARSRRYHHQRRTRARYRCHHFTPTPPTRTLTFTNC
jgi:hypothetical protein